MPLSNLPFARVVTDIDANLSAVHARIQAAYEAYARRRPSLLAVSKGMAESAIRRAFSGGHSEFAESYAQEAIAKIAATKDLAIVWHFIGPIQSNKTSVIAENFAWVHSVDRLKIAARLSAARPADLPPLNICIQINSSGEASKSGVAPTDLIELAKEIVKLPNLVLRGLMAIPAPSRTFDEQRQAFRNVREHFEVLRNAGFALDTLSMGMSDDLEAAIAEGSTMVRVGTAIFGPRA